MNWIHLQHEQKPDERILTETKHCAYCCCCCCKNEVDALEFYTNLRNEADRKLQEKLNSSERVRNKFVFLTFESHDQALAVRHTFTDVFSPVCCFCCKTRNSPKSSVSEKLNIDNWSCRFAPPANLVNYEALSTTGIVWWLRFILVNVFIFVLVFFFSTPPVIMGLLEKTVLSQIPIATQWLPTVIMVAITVGLPMLVEMSVGWIGYYSKLKENQVLLRNVYVFLVMTTIILPTLGLTTVDGFVRSLAEQGRNSSNTEALKWE